MTPTTIAFIFARGGSKGVPRKNIRLFAGRPLIAHAIGTALACPGVQRVIVSTDDAEIATVAQAHGAEVPFLRPAALATDRASEIDAWKHAVRWLQERGEPCDIFLSVPTTSPLRLPQDLAACLATYQSGTADLVITVRPAERNPFFNMVTLDGDYVQLANRPAGAAPVRRQDAPVMYDITTVAYTTSPAWVLSMDRVLAGRVRAVLVPCLRGLDIDTEADFRIAEFCYQQRLHLAEEASVALPA